MGLTVVLSIVLVGVLLMMVSTHLTVVLSLSALVLLLVFQVSLLAGSCMSLGGNVCYDFMSISLTLLSVYVVMLGLISSKMVERSKFLSEVNVVLMVSLSLSFNVSSIFFFFFFFESALAPLLLMILGWGAQPERLQAGVYMLVYTAFGSLFFLLGISYLYSVGMSDQMVGVGNVVYKQLSDYWWLFIIGFMVKIPVYPFHLWLPKAHVEAPVGGSMVLAGVVLKLGGYGLIRLLLMVNVSYQSLMFNGVIAMSLVGGLFCSFICMRQVDLKCLIAYSSVGHMSLVFLGCFSNTILGMNGALFIMIGHGLCSSGLFSLVNLFYGVSGSRSVFMNKGILVTSPFGAMMCFLLCSSNMSAPPSLNLLGECLVFISGGFMSFIYIFICSLISFLSAGYSLYLYTSCCHGGVSDLKLSWVSLSGSDFLVLLFHWVPLNFLFLFV